MNKYKYILSGINNYLNLESIINLLNLNKEEKILFNNYYLLENNTKHKGLSLDEFEDLLEKLSRLKYRDDILEHLYKLSNCERLSDVYQTNTIIRIAENKPLKPVHISVFDIKEKNKNSFIKKACPHCKHINNINYLTNYVICGYNDICNTGYDWEGCGRDWCSLCNKRLCKKWTEDNLFILENRQHNDTCCLADCKKNKLNYLLDYCQCKSINKTINE